MTRTKLCDLLDVDYPIFQAGGELATSATLADNVANAALLCAGSCRGAKQSIFRDVRRGYW